MPNEETYRAAEKSLIDWVDLCISHKLSIPDIVYMMQFRIFDININAREHFFESQKPLEDVNKDDRTNNSICTKNEIVSIGVHFLFRNSLRLIYVEKTKSFHFPSIRYLSFQFFIIHHFTSRGFVRFSVGVRKVELHKPIIVKRFSHRLQFGIDSVVKFYFIINQK